MTIQESSSTVVAVAANAQRPHAESSRERITLRPGVWVQTVQGDHDVDIDLEERQALPGSWGYISGKNHNEPDGMANWDVRFQSGCAVTLTEMELRNRANYQLHEPTTVFQRLLSLAWMLGPGEMTMCDEPCITDAGHVVETAATLGEILKAADALVRRLAAMPGVHSSHYMHLQGLIGISGILPRDDSAWTPDAQIAKGTDSIGLREGV